MMNMLCRILMLVIAVFLKEELLYAVFGAGVATFMVGLVTSIILGYYWNRVYNFLFNTKGVF